MTTIEQAKAARLEKDIAMMQEPSRWTRWPFLPLILRQGQMQDDLYCAVLFSDARPTIYFANLFELSAVKAGQTWGDFLGRFKHRDYATFEALAADYTVD